MEQGKQPDMLELEMKLLQTFSPFVLFLLVAYLEVLSCRALRIPFFFEDQSEMIASSKQKNIPK